MAHGFIALNNNGQVLVSSETRNLHFVGKAAFDRVIRSFAGYGGLRHLAFRINCAVTPVPFFTMPTTDFYAVAAVRTVSGGVWEIEIIRSGTSDVLPEVYVFADPRGATSAETHGMLVMRNDGTPSFDSRMKPLAVTGGALVAPPANPLTTTPTGFSGKHCSTDPGGSMGPNNSTAYAFVLNGVKPIFFYPSLAQAEREFSFSESEEECDGVDAYGNCVGAHRVYSWSSYYWAFYRGGIRATSGVIDAGWITASFGCRWTESLDSSFIGIGTGGDSGDGGTWPYSNETLNLTATAVITADGARYD